MVGIQSYGQLTFARLLLGVAEAGFFPGIVFYLTFFFTPKERAQRLAFIFAAQPVSGMLGGLLAYPILHSLDGALGMAGWRWVFLLEGSPTVLLGIVTWHYLPASPAEAPWLTQEEKQFMSERMRGSRTHGNVPPEAEEGQHQQQAEGVGSHEAPPSRLSEQSRSSSSSTSSSHELLPTSELTPVIDHPQVRRPNGMAQVSSAWDAENVFESDAASAAHVTEDTTSSMHVGTELSPGGNSNERTIYPAVSSHGPAWRVRLQLLFHRSRLEFLSLYRSTFSNRFFYLCIAANFLILMPVQALTFFLPAITSEMGVGPLVANAVSAIPYSLATLAIFAVSIHSDRKGERVWHVIACNVLGFVSVALTAYTLTVAAKREASDAAPSASPDSALVFWQLFFLSLTAAGVWGGKPSLMAFFSSHLQGNVAVAIAAVTTAGNVSGIVCGPIMAALRGGSQDYSSGCVFLMVSPPLPHPFSAVGKKKNKKTKKNSNSEQQDARKIGSCLFARKGTFCALHDAQLLTYAVCFFSLFLFLPSLSAGLSGAGEFDGARPG